MTEIVKFDLNGVTIEVDRGSADEKRLVKLLDEVEENKLAGHRTDAYNKLATDFKGSYNLFKITLEDTSSGVEAKAKAEMQIAALVAQTIVVRFGDGKISEISIYPTASVTIKGATKRGE